MRKGDWIQTYMGIHMYPFDPIADEICIEDIAHSLSLICRYGGHCEQFYSVAEHSVLCSQYCNEKLRFPALMHDASEAYIADICRPVKRSMPQYQEIERMLMTAIGEKFHIAYEDFDAVKEIDDIILATEAVQVFRGGICSWTWNPEKTALPIKLMFLSPKDAEKIFLDRFKQLQYEKGDGK